MAISHPFVRAAAASVAALFMASPAHANIVFDFSGGCEIGCSGAATGVLTRAMILLGFAGPGYAGYRRARLLS
jgi:hypothetical protein